MADVMGRGHDGDGNEERPPPFGPGRGQHQRDVIPPKKTRGLAKNVKMRAAYKKNGFRPLPLVFDKDTRAATFTTVGDINDWLVREIGMIMSKSIPYDRPDWKSVDDCEKDALIKGLKVYFDLEQISQDPQYRLMWEGITSIMQNTYSNRKSKAKRYFKENGGYDDIERALAHPPPGMRSDFWERTVIHFRSEQHQKISKANSENRQKLPYTNYGGSSTYSSTAFKEKLTRIEVFRKGHTDKNGNFVSQLAEQQYNEIMREIIQQTQGTVESNNSAEDSNNSIQLDEVTAFEKIMGVRRGRVRGIGRKPSTTSSSYCEGESSHAPQCPQPIDPFDAFLDNPKYRSQMKEMFRKFAAEQNNGDENGGNEGQDDIGDSS